MAAAGETSVQDNCEYLFPFLNVYPAVRQWQPEEGGLLILRASARMDFEAVGRKNLYRLGVKVTNLHSLAGVKASKWSFGEESSLGGVLAVPEQTPCRQKERGPLVEDCTWGHSYKQVSGTPWSKGDPSSLCLESDTTCLSSVPGWRSCSAICRCGSGEGFSFIYSPDSCARSRNFLSGTAKLKPSGKWERTGWEVRGQRMWCPW